MFENLLFGLIGILIVIETSKTAKVPYSARHRKQNENQSNDIDFKIDITPVLKVYFDKTEDKNEENEEKEKVHFFKSSNKKNSLTINLKDIFEGQVTQSEAPVKRFKFLGNEDNKEKQKEKSDSKHSEEVFDISFQTSTKFYSNESDLDLSSAELFKDDFKEVMKKPNKKIKSKKKDLANDKSASIDVKLAQSEELKKPKKKIKIKKKDLPSDKSLSIEEKMSKKGEKWSDSWSHSDENFKRVKKPVTPKEESKSNDFDNESVDSQVNTIKTTVKTKKRKLRTTRAKRKTTTTTTTTEEPETTTPDSLETVETTTKRRRKKTKSTTKRERKALRKKRVKRPKNPEEEPIKHKRPSERIRNEHKMHISKKLKGKKKKNVVANEGTKREGTDKAAGRDGTRSNDTAEAVVTGQEDPVQEEEKDTKDIVATQVKGNTSDNEIGQNVSSIIVQSETDDDATPMKAEKSNNKKDEVLGRLYIEN